MIKKYIGLEIELIYNSQILNIRMGDYHNGIKILKYWSCERDGSLRNGNNPFKSWTKSCEFISIKLDSPKKVNEAIKELIDFLSNKGKYSLNEVININDSCGSHIHLSIFKNRKELRFIYYSDLKLLTQIRKKTLKELKNNESIYNHYFRGYAKKTTKKDLYQTNNRYKEFNFNSEYENKGFEWRSPNLNNISSWQDFKNYLNIYVKNSYLMLNKLLNNKTTKHIKIKEEYNEIPQEKIIKLSIGDS